MNKHLLLTPLVFLATACTISEPADDGRQAEEEAREADIARAEPPFGLPSRGEPQPGDLPPCPGINPDIRRPAGSNCLGILPQQCGADKAQGFVGQKGTPAIREKLQAMAKSTENGNFRWITPDMAVIQDLRPHRFNVELDSDGRIAKIDCY